jgi:hypothetical protein
MVGQVVVCIGALHRVRQHVVLLVLTMAYESFVGVELWCSAKCTPQAVNPVTTAHCMCNTSLWSVVAAVAALVAVP